MDLDRLLKKAQMVYHINGIKDENSTNSRISKTVIEK
jgi:hypothetical protein